jgi:hypothetical protein
VRHLANFVAARDWNLDVVTASASCRIASVMVVIGREMPRASSRPTMHAIKVATAAGAIARVCARLISPV